jgi:hypothetical protein
MNCLKPLKTSLGTSLLLTLLILCGCGASGLFGCDEYSSDGISVTSVSWKPQGYYGYTEAHCDGSTSIELWSGISSWDLKYFIAHELWHAAGYFYHLEYPCNSARVPGRSICPEEAYLMGQAGGHFWISCPPWMRFYVLEAAAMWNNATGKVIFSVL